MPLYTLRNPSPTQPPLTDPLPPAFALRAPPVTDVWRKPPSTNTFNAPHLIRTLPLSTLRSARVTISASWATKFDQAGLILILPSRSGKKEKQWIKTGIEFFESRPNISTVACDTWADWSLAPSPSGKATVEMTREVLEDGEKTSPMWVHSVEVPSTGERRRALREISWAFEEGNSEDECEVGVYVAKPIADEIDPEKELEVRFEDLRVETW
ncbi:MAG: hypothetical protein Q9216_004344 [Gyalolechia sp. 2 TL-2023]